MMSLDEKLGWGGGEKKGENKMEIRPKMQTQELIINDKLGKPILAKKTEKSERGYLGKTWIMEYYGRKWYLKWSEQTIGQLLKCINGEVPGFSDVGVNVFSENRISEVEIKIRWE